MPHRGDRPPRLRHRLRRARRRTTWSPSSRTVASTPRRSRSGARCSTARASSSSPTTSRCSPDGARAASPASGVTTLFLTTALFNAGGSRGPRGVRAGAATCCSAARRSEPRRGARVLRTARPRAAAQRLRADRGDDLRDAGTRWRRATPTARRRSRSAGRSPTPRSTCSTPQRRAGARRRRRASSTSAATGSRAATSAGPSSPPSASCRDPFADDPARGSTAPATSCATAADGAIEFLGRADRQVKIRGLPDRARARSRRRSRALPQVRRRSCVLRGATSDDRAGSSPTSSPADADGPDADATLRATCGAALPDYMLPAALRLPGGAAAHAERQGRPPRAAASPRTAPARAGVVVPAARHARADARRDLGGGARRHGVGVHDNFFELGGHSLLARGSSTRSRRGSASRCRSPRCSPTTPSTASAGAARRGDARAEARCSPINGGGARGRRSSSCTATSPAAASSARRSPRRSARSAGAMRCTRTD